VEPHSDCRRRAPIAATPVRPCDSSLAVVSSFTGVRLLTSMIADTWLGSSCKRSISRTSPTRKPLNSTCDPRDRPDTEPVKMI